MSKTLDGPTTTAIDTIATRPLFFVEMRLNAVPDYLRLNDSGANVTWTSVWTDADMKVFIDGETARVQIFNVANTYSTIFLDGANDPSGRIIKIWKAYWTNNTTHTTPMQAYLGEMRGIDIDNYVTIEARRKPPVRIGKYKILPPTFNHIPPKGTRIQTTTGWVKIGE